MTKFLLSTFITLLFCGFVLAQESKPLKILEKPLPQLTQEQIKQNIFAQGTIALKVEFLATGKIGNISPITKLPYGLTENAVEAAKKIRFEPAIKDNKPINTSKIVLYTFLYGWIKETDRVEDTKEDNSKVDEKAEAVLKKAVEKLGGEKYLQVKSTVGRGRFSILSGGAIVSFQSFVDVIVHPDKERTEFKDGAKTVQTNTGDTGWIYDGNAETINLQNKDQIESFKRSLRVSLDNLLRGYWRGKGVLSYVGKRAATLGKRNEVVKLTFDDDFTVEFEFSDENLPVKALYKRLNADKEEIKEEDRYAQFVDFQGIKTPLIVDHFSNAVQTSRINYESIEFNKTISEKIFAKPNNPKELKKDLKL